MSHILAIDTSTEACSVALLTNSHIEHQYELSKQNHAALILPMIDSILKKTNLTISNLDAIAFTKGPGSFTGVRIGISVAQGLSFGANKPLISISTLKALAYGAYKKTGRNKICAAIDARMNEIYIACFLINNKKIEITLKEKVISPNDANKIFKANNINIENYSFCGSGFETYPFLKENLLSANLVLPNAKDMLDIAEIKLKQNNILTAEQIEAAYIRNKITWNKLPGRG